MRSPDEQPDGAAGRLHRALRPLESLERERTAWLVLGCAMGIYAAVALYLTRGTTLFVDEINIFTLDRGLHPSALLAPLNGHLVLFQRLLYAVDFKLFGAADFLLPRLAQVAGVIVSIGLFFVFVRRRIGSAAALPAAVLLLFLGSAWELNFVPSGLGNVYAVASGLGALLALERRDGRGDLIACVLLVAAAASFTLGVAFSVGALVLLLLEPRWRRRLWIPLSALALWGAWLIWVRAVYVPTHGEAQQLDAWNILTLPNYIADEAGAVLGALAGLNYDFYGQSLLPIFTTESRYGPVLAVLAAVGLALRLRRGPATPLLWAVLATLLAFWAELGLGYGTGRNPSTVRYAYGGGFLVLLVAAEAARGWRFSRRALGGVYLVALLALGANLAHLRQGGHVFRSLTTGLRAQLTGLEFARDHVAPSFSPQGPGSNLQVVKAGSYLSAVDRNGSPAYSPSQLLQQSEELRHETDAISVSALGVTLTPSIATDQPRNCRRLVAPASGTITVPPPGVVMFSSSVAALAARRFASTTTVPVGTAAAGRRFDLHIPADRSTRSWEATLTPAPATLNVCSLG